MGISGNLKTMVLAELLQWLSMGSKTGTLVIENEGIEKKIFFSDGAILSSASNDPAEYLGSFLSSHCFLSSEVVEQALARQKAEKRLLGQILVDMEAISEEDLHQMLRLKTEETIYDIFTWEQGDFEFLDDQLPEESMIRMALDVQGLVLEGSRRIDEWSRIQEWVPSPKCVPVAIVDLQALELEEMDLRILEWIDDDRTVEDISKGSQTGLFDVANVIATQVKDGTVKVVRPRTVEVEVPVRMAPQPGASQHAEPQPIPAAIMHPPPGANPGVPVGDPVALSSGRELRFATDAAASGTFPAQPDAAATSTFPAQPGAAATGTFPAQPGAAATGTFPAQPGAAATGTFPAQPSAAATGTFPAQASAAATGTFPAQQTPADAAGSEAEGLVKAAEDSLAQGDLETALATFRKAQQAAGGSAVEDLVKDGERKVQEALERDGIRLNIVPRLNCGMDQLTQLSISPQEGFMLTRVDGSYDLKSILKMSPMPAVDAQLLFWRLKKLGHVAV